MIFFFRRIAIVMVHEQVCSDFFLLMMNRQVNHAMC